MNYDEYERDVVTRQTPHQKAYSHFTHSRLGVCGRDGLSQAYAQKDAIYRIGNSVYVAESAMCMTT